LQTDKDAQLDLEEVDRVVDLIESAQVHDDVGEIRPLSCITAGRRSIRKTDWKCAIPQAAQHQRLEEIFTPLRTNNQIQQLLQTALALGMEGRAPRSSTASTTLQLN